MAKGFPYFKFIATEWLTGDIVYEDFELQGIFINVCALYWHRDGNLTVTEVKKRLKNDRVSELVGTIINVKEDKISINFLDEQLIDANHVSKVNSENGKKGGRPRKEKPTENRTVNEIKPKKSKEEIEEELKLELEKKKKEFSDTLKPFLETYGSKMLNEFYLYWTEPTQDKKPKLKFELEKTWSLERRLSTWKNYENKFGNNQQQPNNSKPNYKRLD